MHRSHHRLSRIAAFSFLGLAVSSIALHRSVAVEPAPMEILTSIDNDRLLEIMRKEGYTADVNAKGVVSWTIEGFRAQMFISQNGGENIMFHAAFEDGNATAAKVNEWNATNRYSRTYLDGEGHPHLELDLDLRGGVTRDRVVNYLHTCRKSFGVWHRKVIE